MEKWMHESVYLYLRVQGILALAFLPFKTNIFNNFIKRCKRSDLEVSKRTDRLSKTSYKYKKRSWEAKFSELEGPMDVIG